MSRLPPLKSLHFFLLAAQQQSFKKAAEKLYVTQAAVSQQIRGLEEHLSCKLFERHGKSTVLTAQGRQLLPFIELGFEQMTKGLQMLSGDPKPNVLRLSTLHSFTSLWLIPRLQQFQDLHPDIMVQLAPSNELVDFKDGDIDLAIRMGWGKYDDVVAKKILSDNLLLVASPELLEGVDKHDPDQVLALPWIEDTSRGIQLRLKDFCQQFGIERSSLVPTIQSANAVPLIENAVQGRGVVMANSCLVADHLRTGRLEPLLGYSVDSPYSLFMVAPELNFGWEKVRKFEEWFVPEVKESFADLNLW